MPVSPLASPILFLPVQPAQSPAEQLVHNLVFATYQGEVATRQALEKVSSEIWNRLLATEGLCPNGYSPLHHSAHQGSESVTRLLLGYGISADGIRDKYGNTALMLAVSQGYEDVALCLLQYGANPNTQNYHGDTPLLLAVQKGFRGMVDLLTENGGNPNVASLEGETPLLQAVIFGHADIVELLIRRGAYVNTQDEEGDTLLHWCVREGRKELLPILVRLGADLKLENEDGENVIEFARSLGEDLTLYVTVPTTAMCF